MSEPTDYLSQTLAFFPDRIEVAGTGEQVMMDWEAPLMEKMAEIATLRCGDVLEIGFGMGLSCSAVQARPHRSHTIVEAHPQIIPRARAWAESHPSARIAAGRWQDVLTSLGTYDGVSFDIYGGTAQREEFLRVLPRLLEPGGVATLWLPDQPDIRAVLRALLDRLGYRHRLERVRALPPKHCTYSRSTEYYVPIITLGREP